MKSKKIIIIILSVILVVGIACGGIFFFNKKKPNNEIMEETEIIPIIRPSASVVINDSEDLDGDGLLNGEEKYYHTDVFSTDTDGDGLSDTDEVKKYFTDPLKKDTDGDGLTDGAEVAFSLNPNSDKTDGKNKDSVKTFDKEFLVNNAQLNVKGNANIANIYTGVSTGINLSNTPGIAGELYDIYMENMKFDTASLTLYYKPEEIKKLGLDENNLTIYQFLNDGTFESVGGILNKETHSVSVSLNHFSRYVLADRKILEKNTDDIDVFLLIDDSGSMYPEELCEGSNENDVEFRRLDFVESLIYGTDDKVRYGLATFTGDYKQYNAGFNNAKESLQESIDEIKLASDHNFNGTYIANSIKSALKEFSNEDVNHKKYIILLTDGETTEGGLWDFTFYNEKDAIRDAKEKNVSIITIGLGNDVDREYLSKIAVETGGIYVYAPNANSLESVINKITSGINNNLVDLDGDGENDNILIADSGFDVLKNGYSFENYIYVPSYSDTEKINGQCAGLSAVAQLYYTGRLPVKRDYVEKYNATLRARNLEGAAYDITDHEFFTNDGKYVTSKKNLYDYVPYPPTNDLGFRSDPDDQYFIRMSEKLEKLIAENPFMETYLIEFSEVKKHIITGDTEPYREFNKLEKYYISNYNIDESTLTKEQKDTHEFLEMVNNYYGAQYKDELYITYDFATTAIKEGARDEQFNLIVNAINNGVPLVVNGPEHAINLIRIYQNINNPLEYHFIVYDNNSPGEEKEILVKKVKVEGLLDKAGINNWFNDYDYIAYDVDNIFTDDGQAIKIDFKEYY